jgi:tetratricopeptide (TPR) repeat protein
VRAVFSWSYHALDPGAARLFRLLGSHPGPDVSMPAAASLAALPGDQARKALAVLTAAHLIAEPTPDRYVLHDLLRAYAAELSRAEDSNVERLAAVGRMLDHYLHTAYSIALLVSPSRAPIALSVPAPGVVVEPLADRKQGLAWLAAEHQVLIAGVELAAGAGLDFCAWALAWSIAEYLDRHGHWPVYARTQEIAQEAAKRLADPAALAFSHRSLSTAYIRLGRDDEALHQLREALAVSTEVGDQLGQAGALLNIGFAYTAQRRHADALRESQRALDLFRKVGKPRGEARALNAIGWCHTQLGDHEQAIVHCAKALAVMQELDDRHGLGLTYDSLGYAYHQLGDHDRAAGCFQKAIDLFSDFGDRFDQANSMTRLGDLWRADDDDDAARDLYEQALAILDALGHPGAAQVRDRLGSLEV